MRKFRTFLGLVCLTVLFVSNCQCGNVESILDSIGKDVSGKNIGGAIEGAEKLKKVLDTDLKRASRYFREIKDSRYVSEIRNLNDSLILIGPLLTTLKDAKDGKVRFSTKDYANFVTCFKNVNEPVEDFKVLEDQVLFADQDIILWTADCSTRVPFEGFLPDVAVWRGESVGLRASDEYLDAMKARKSDVGGVAVSAARGERESFQIVVTPKVKGRSVSSVTVSNLKSGDSTIDKSNVRFNQVGYVWGRISDSGDGWDRWRKPGEIMGPYPDVLFPAFKWTNADAGQNFTIWCTVSVPYGTEGGDYSGTIKLVIDGESKELPLKVRVYDFDMPKEAMINTCLFSLDVSSVCNHYRIAPWQDEAQEIFKKWQDIMVEHKFSTTVVPAYPRENYEQFPVLSRGVKGKSLKFSGESFLVGGPDDKDMTDGFSVAFWLKTVQGMKGDILRQHWIADFGSMLSSRPVGYSIRIDDGMLKASIGHGLVEKLGTEEEKHLAGYNLKRGNPYSELKVRWAEDGKWHRVVMSYSPADLVLYVDGKKAGDLELNNSLEPSRGIIALGGEKSVFEIDEVKWYEKPLTESLVSLDYKGQAVGVKERFSYSFDEKLFDFGKKNLNADSEALDEAHFWANVKWWLDRGLYINTLKPLYGLRIEKIGAIADKYYDKLKELDAIDKCTVYLPHDESPFGPLAEANRKFADELHKQMPGIQALVTLGGMKGSSSSREEKAKAIGEYGGYGDVWSMIPSIYSMFYEDYFKKYQAMGNKIAPYIHRTDTLQDDNTTVASRRFFWYLWKYDLDMLTLWNTTLWVQPTRLGGLRPGKDFEPKVNGFLTIKRNHGISDGTMFYPGDGEVLGSIRAANWREGIEDYEYLRVLEQSVEAAKDKGAGVKYQRAVELLDKLKDIKVYGVNWEKPPTKDTSFFYSNRKKIAECIESLN